jgi:hypothetical protein
VSCNEAALLLFTELGANAEMLSFDPRDHEVEALIEKLVRLRGAEIE